MKIDQRRRGDVFNKRNLVKLNKAAKKQRLHSKTIRVKRGVRHENEKKARSLMGTTGDRGPFDLLLGIISRKQYWNTRFSSG